MCVLISQWLRPCPANTPREIKSNGPRNTCKECWEGGARHLISPCLLDRRAVADAQQTFGLILSVYVLREGVASHFEDGRLVASLLSVSRDALLQLSERDVDPRALCTPSHADARERETARAWRRQADREKHADAEKEKERERDARTDRWSQSRRSQSSFHTHTHRHHTRLICAKRVVDAM